MCDSTIDLLFCNFNLWDLELRHNGECYEFFDKNGIAVINKSVYLELSELLSYITGHEKNKRKKFGTEQAKKRWIDDIKYVSQYTVGNVQEIHGRFEI